MVCLGYFPAYLLYCIVTHFILDNKCYQSNTAASQNYHSFHVNIAQNVSGDSGFSWRNWSQNVRNHLLVKLKKVSTVGYPSVWRFAQVTRQFASAHFIFWVGKAARKQKAKQPETICSVSSFGLIVPLSTVCLSLLVTDFLTTLAEFTIRVESFNISSATLLTSCTRNSVLILLEASCSPSVLCDNSESISSMKITAGRWHLATANNARTIFSPSPTYKTNKHQQ